MSMRKTQSVTHQKESRRGVLALLSWERMDVVHKASGVLAIPKVDSCTSKILGDKDRLHVAIAPQI
jgi:hypothetical protein